MSLVFKSRRDNESYTGGWDRIRYESFQSLMKIDGNNFLYYSQEMD
jgi:hypothetical protein